MCQTSKKTFKIITERSMDRSRRNQPEDCVELSSYKLVTELAAISLDNRCKVIAIYYPAFYLTLTLVSKMTQINLKIVLTEVKY